MAERTPGWVPRSFLVNSDEFAAADDPAAVAATSVEEAGQLGASLAQHRAARVIRSKRDAGQITVRALAEASGVSEDYLSGQLTGRYPAGLDDMIRWAVVLDDVTLLPVFDTLAELRPASPPSDG